MAHTAGMGARRELLVTEVACLAGGRWGATRTGLVMLLARGLLGTNMAGRIERRGSSPRAGEPLERALFTALVGRSGAREVAEKPRMRRALVQLRRGLERRGLLRRWYVRVLAPLALTVVPGWLVARLAGRGVVSPTVAVWLVAGGAVAACFFLPRRRLAGARELRRLRAAHAGLIDAEENLSPEQQGLAVALFGDAALLRIMPRLARGVGLLDGGRWSRFVHHGNGGYGDWTETASNQMNDNNPASP
ncbi:TIGR04222 domain-containing membrane protein [Asanoa sp. WMMD1127]|uniref:TIGR04222 domain-containing membrane protein n=1 Tax=Asanoa sp. WMMD1127 TaxID=3016107 RepID=UPI002416AA91|nr:TIGR04222 domain-containing membrane protein [Asanoa sp. WMMD1127]MDG4825651.1 TIGR04222 domain-containing membrane protein [Asanoa sp. WMMD1127]